MQNAVEKEGYYAAESWDLSDNQHELTIGHQTQPAFDMKTGGVILAKLRSRKVRNILLPCVQENTNSGGQVSSEFGEGMNHIRIFPIGFQEGFCANPNFSFRLKTHTAVCVVEYGHERV